MAYIYYPTSNCGESGVIPDYTCSPCPAYEFGRVRSIFYKKTSYDFVDPTDPTEWTTAIENKDVIVLWETQGTYDGGTTEELAGFGDRETTNGGTTHILTYKDPNYSDNCDFYNAIKTSNEYEAGFRTSSKIHFTDAPVTITPKNPIADDLKSIVVWEVQLKWQNSNSPCPYDTPEGTFENCYAVAP